MVVKKLNKIKRVISSSTSVNEAEEAVGQTEESQKERVKKACSFCQKKLDPSYTDINTLRRFLTDRAKIVPKSKSSLCSKHQRIVTKQIKYARHLSLLSFIPKL